MVEQMLPDIFRIEIPLPKNPLKSLNSYLVRGKERSLIIDTGMNRPACREAMFADLDTLKVDLNKTDFFVTHLHADHLGQVGDLATESSKVYFSETETRVVEQGKNNREERFQKFFDFYVANGFPREELEKAFQNHPGYLYSTKREIEFSTLSDGDTLEVGNSSFRGVATPGHSPGHMCLYEPDRKILLSGDHILFDITPNITWWPDLPNSLAAYYESLEKVGRLEVDHVLPGHRAVIGNHRSRIAELKEHHGQRLGEALTALEEGAKTAWDVAPGLTWDVGFGAWPRFPPIQKWFALGETIAHLNYLEGKGRAQKKTAGGQVRYAPAAAA